jgi:hypothetical protein
MRKSFYPRLRPLIKSSRIIFFSQICYIYIFRTTNGVNYQPDPTQDNPKINGSNMGLIFFYPNRIGSGSDQPNPTRLIMIFEVIL